MNIKPEQLQNSLSKQIASIYFAFGAEILLVEQSLSMIKEVAKQDGFNERFRFDIVPREISINIKPKSFFKVMFSCNTFNH